MTFSDILKERQQESGLSQAKLGKLVGSKERTVRNIETGRTVPADQTIWKFGAALCVSIDEIMECLELADYHRKNRDELKNKYAIQSADKTLNLI
jgi:ribosome-binding protein aMBF1 (putative translation factor)